jgi:sulfur relay (sulfurtransferase) complex TusBCD TusD component (DsrE family)
MIMLFHDAVTIAVKGAHEKMMPAGPPPRFAEVFSHANSEIVVCKACAMVRGITEDGLTANCRFGGMDAYHDHVSRDDCKAVSF